jgi:hypothetical protein
VKYLLPQQRGTVIHLRDRRVTQNRLPPNPWHELTAELVKAKAARGELEPALLDALLLAAGVTP